VSGAPQRDVFSIQVRIGLVPHPRLGRVHAAADAGKQAVSHVKVLACREGATLVEVTIPTGRPHQIRIHLAAAGHPLVGDPLYGVGGVPTVEPGLPGDLGYWLHAQRLRVAHPETAAPLVIECAAPPMLRP
jgi:23S rRNA pseudouridine1911/1915/1917 synthase